MRRILAISGVLIVVGMLLVPYAVGTPELAKKENKTCTYCHTAVGKPDLNDAGKYYKEHNSFDGYQPKR